MSSTWKARVQLELSLPQGNVAILYNETLQKFFLPALYGLVNNNDPRSANEHQCFFLILGVYRSMVRLSKLKSGTQLVKKDTELSHLRK